MRLLTATTTVALLLVTPVSQAAGIAPKQQNANVRGVPSSTADDQSPRLFPFLAKIRDTAVEVVFGRHPTKTSGTLTGAQTLRAQYANELVLRFNVTTTDEEAALSEAAARLFLDIWAFTGDYVDIRLHADEVGPLLSLLPSSLQAAQSTLIPDLAAAVYQSMPVDGSSSSVTPESAPQVLTNALSGTDNLFFEDYQPFPVVVRWMKLLGAMFPAYVDYMTIGQSYEGRDIPALRVGLPLAQNPSARRKTIIITGGLHAREWISTSTVNYVAWSFITSYGKDTVVTKFLDEFDMVFIPTLNPDGVEYTWQVDRLWRKSRQQTNLRFCRGLDLDHAFGYEWDSARMQGDPCSESFGGDAPFQAVEAMELAEWARNETLRNNVQFVGFLDLHSYSQQILFPYSFSCDSDPPNLENLQELAMGMGKAIRLSNGERYSVASACEGAVAAGKASQHMSGARIEAAGGSAIDWFYHEMQAHFSYQIKLRDTGSYGFLLPKENIIPTGEEMLGAVKYYGDYLLGNNGIESVSTTSESDGSEELLQEADAAQELRRRRRARK